MAALANADILDAALNLIANNADEIVLLANYTAVYSDTQSDTSAGGERIAKVSSLTSGNWTLAAGGTDGRKITSDAQTSVSVSTTTASTATHLAWVDTTNSRILVVTEIEPDRAGLSSGDTVDIPASSYTLRAPTFV